MVPMWKVRICVGGASLVMAGIAAKGTTKVQKVEYILRGYDNLDKKLNSLGAHIVREEGVED